MEYKVKQKVVDEIIKIYKKHSTKTDLVIKALGEAGRNC